MTDFDDILKKDLYDELPDEVIDNFLMLFNNISTKIDFKEILKGSDTAFLLLVQNKGKSWVYSNELPDATLNKFIIEYFFNEPRAMEFVMQSVTHVKNHLFAKREHDKKEKSKKYDQESDQDENKEDTLKSSDEIKIQYKDPEEQLPPEYLHEKYNISTKTLANWRSEKRGPKYIKMGKRIRYLRKDVEKWFAENTVKTYNKPKKA